MNDAEIRRLFSEFCGVDRYGKFAAAIWSKAIPKQRLTFWQEQLWREFTTKTASVVLPTAFSDIFRVFQVCPQHLEPVSILDPPDASAVTRLLEPVVSDRESFSFAIIQVNQNEVVGTYSCALCRAALEAYAAKLPGRAIRIASEFPPGVSMPDELQRLCDLLDRTGYPISGHMRLRPKGDALKHWFGEGTEAWKQLAGFGAGPDGSILAFWLYAGPDATCAPVVHLGSEGDHVTVIADNCREFLSLLAIGYNELGFDDLNLPPAEPESAEKLRRWLASEYGLSAPPTGAEIVQKATAHHPDFGQWVRATLAERDSNLIR